MIRPVSLLCATAGLVVLTGAATSASAQSAPGAEQRTMPLPPSARTPPKPEDGAQRPQPQKRQAAPAASQKRTPDKKPEPRRAQPQPTPPEPAQAAPPTPSQGLQGWFPMPPKSAKSAPAQRPTLTSANLRPPENTLLDCKDAPKAAVTQLPEPLARWATIYCGKRGHVFSYNDRHLARFPRTPALGVFSAAELTGRKGELGHAAHFTNISYKPLSKEEAQALSAGADPRVANFIKDKQLFRIDLTVDTGQTFSMVAADPEKDPFWVVTIVDGKLARGFFVASLDYLNKRP